MATTGKTMATTAPNPTRPRHTNLRCSADAAAQLKSPRESQPLSLTLTPTRSTQQDETETCTQIDRLTKTNSRKPQCSDCAARSLGWAPKACSSPLASPSWAAPWPSCASPCEAAQ
eukprot:6200087-Pleurochrysis_carterae.AAC.1